MKRQKTFGGVKLYPCPACGQQPWAGIEYTQAHIPWSEERINQPGGPWASEGDFLPLVRCYGSSTETYNDCDDLHDEWSLFIRDAVGGDRQQAAEEWNAACSEFRK